MIETDPSTMPEDDVELLRLGAEFQSFWAAERDFAKLDDAAYDDNAFKAAREKTASVVQEIAQLDATTLPGLCVQARASLWLDDDDYLPIDIVRSEWSLRRKIVAGVIRLGEEAESNKGRAK